MSNKYNKFITALFCTFLGGMLVVSTLLPDKEMSELENPLSPEAAQIQRGNSHRRHLYGTGRGLCGRHIAGRDFWVAAKAWCERLSGKRENNGVYFGKQDTLLNRVDTPPGRIPPLRRAFPPSRGF